MKNIPILLTPKVGIPVLFLTGIIFLPLGIALLLASQQVFFFFFFFFFSFLPFPSSSFLFFRSFFLDSNSLLSRKRCSSLSSFFISFYFLCILSLPYLGQWNYHGLFPVSIFGNWKLYRCSYGRFWVEKRFNCSWTNLHSQVFLHWFSRERE